MSKVMLGGAMVAMLQLGDDGVVGERQGDRKDVGEEQVRDVLCSSTPCD